MGYNLYIGKKYVDQVLLQEYIDDGYDKDEAEDLSTKAKGEYRTDSPSFGEPTDGSNERWPSYSGWHDVCKGANLMDLFYDGGTLKGGHPGYFQITEEWLNELNARIEVFESIYPQCTPSYDETLESAKVFTMESKQPVNFILCRTEWLKFWCNYAYNTYGEDAVFANS